MSRRLLREQQGASSVFVALCMVVLLIAVALVVDIGATAARKAQLQDAADAAALAVAQLCYEAPATNELAGCAPATRTSSVVTANEIARDTMNNSSEPLTALAPVWGADLHTVTLEFTSVQASLFSWSAGAGAATVVASATAQWQQPATALPLAVSACSLPPADPATTAFVGTGLYDGVANLLGSVVGKLGNVLDVPNYLDNVLSCGLTALTGGWLGNGLDDCSYDPMLLTTLSSTVERLLPINTLFPSACSNVIRELVGKRIIVPVYDNSTAQLLGQALDPLLDVKENVTFAEIVVTGYEFDGVLGLGTLESYPTPKGPSCAKTLNELLGIGDGVVRALLVNLLGPVLGGLLAGLGSIVDSLIGLLTNVLGQVLVDQLLEVVNLCQGVQGKVVASGMTAQEAADRLVPYRLIA